jgi:preprotein translocase subunit Sec61beta
MSVSKLLVYDGKRPWSISTRVSFENSFDSKQPKLEPKLVSALSETKLLFRLFRFYTETASFGVSIEPKQAEDQPKQTDMW